MTIIIYNNKNNNDANNNNAHNHDNHNHNNHNANDNNNTITRRIRRITIIVIIRKAAK